MERIHEKGILHRDISADNIMITQEGRLKLIDFGAANFFNVGREEHTVLIKRGFVPVEQYRTEERMGSWSDVYALCATMYFMITGMVPEDAMERWINDRLTDLGEIYGTGLSAGQSAAIMKGLAVRKEERYQELGQLCQELYSQEGVQKEKLWFRTEEMPHQILPGHTQTLRREASSSNKNSTGTTAQKASPAPAKKPVVKDSTPKADTAEKGGSKKSEFEGDLDDLLQ